MTDESVIKRIVWPHVYRLPDGSTVAHAFFYTIYEEITTRKGKVGRKTRSDHTPICDSIEGVYVSSPPLVAVTCRDCNRRLHGES